MTPRDRFRQNTADALRDWRLGPGLPPRHDWRQEQSIYFEGLAEIIALRLYPTTNALVKTTYRIDALYAAVVAQLKPVNWSGRK